MSQCVPSWEVEEDNPTPSRLTLRSNSNSTVPAVSILDYEVAELTWENGQLAMHGLGFPRAAMSGKLAPTTTATSTPPNHPKSAAWGGDKPRACGTLESIVNQASHLAGSGAKVATQLPFGVEAGPGVNELVTWLDHNQRVAAAATMAMDALVPCSNNPTTLPDDRAKAARNNTRAVEFPPVVAGMGGSARVGSCGGPVAVLENGRRGGKVAARPEWSGRDQSACGSASTLGRDSQRVTLDTYERDTGLGFTSTTSFGSHDDYTSSGKPGTRTAATCTADENDSACHSRPQARLTFFVLTKNKQFISRIIHSKRT
ncbi:Transcription factor UNE10 [Linum grandiflorum]